MSQSAAAANAVQSNSFFSASLAESDPQIARSIELELGRQRDEIELIASENIVSRAVLEAQGSVMTNKYAEGYPGRRYYGGCQFVDIAENLAIERVTQLFGCKFANVQPNSGSQANQAVFLALLQPGDVFMGLDLAAGGASLSRGINMIYTRSFLQTLKPKCLQKLEQFPNLFDREKMLKARNLYEFDNVVTAPLHGYRDTDDYWNRASAKHVLPSIVVPTLVLNARNDPFLPAKHLPRSAADAVLLEYPAHGGHVGFARGRPPGHLDWLPRRLVRFLNDQVNLRRQENSSRST